MYCYTLLVTTNIDFFARWPSCRTGFLLWCAEDRRCFWLFFFFSVLFLFNCLKWPQLNPHFSTLYSDFFFQLCYKKMHPLFSPLNWLGLGGRVLFLIHSFWRIVNTCFFCFLWAPAERECNKRCGPLFVCMLLASCIIPPCECSQRKLRLCEHLN